MINVTFPAKLSDDHDGDTAGGGGTAVGGGTRPITGGGAVGITMPVGGDALACVSDTPVGGGTAGTGRV